jgi:hypothetical protein
LLLGRCSAVDTVPWRVLTIVFFISLLHVVFLLDIVTFIFFLLLLLLLLVVIIIVVVVFNLVDLHVHYARSLLFGIRHVGMRDCLGNHSR